MRREISGGRQPLAVVVSFLFFQENAKKKNAQAWGRGGGVTYKGENVWYVCVFFLAPVLFSNLNTGLEIPAS